MQETYAGHYKNEPKKLAEINALISNVNSSKGNQTCLLEQGILKLLDKNTGNNSNNSNEDVELIQSQKQHSPYLLWGEGVRYNLHYGENHIGRAKLNHLIIDDMHVSRVHCVIVVHSDNRVEIFESSTNGTTLNSNKMVGYSKLAVGDSISLAPSSANYSFILCKQDDVLISSLGDESAYVQAKNNLTGKLSTNSNRSGFSLIELLIVITIVGIIAAISIPNLLSSRRAANSASAIQTMRLISTSQASYGAGVGNGEYATVDNLVKEQYIDASIGAASLPSQSTVQQPKSGYVFFFNTIPSDPSTNTLPSYSVSARPLVNGSNGLIISGNKSFYIDNSGVIKVSNSPLAPYADANSAALN